MTRELLAEIIDAIKTGALSKDRSISVFEFQVINDAVLSVRRKYEREIDQLKDAVRRISA